MPPKATIVRENKAFAVQIKEFDDAQGRIKGYLSTFDNVDEGKDRVRPGAFKRTLANKYTYKQKHEKRYVMPFLWQHDTTEPVGGFLELKEDTVGLWFDLEIDLDIQRGRECYSGYKKGYIYQTSMGYDCLQSEYVKVDGDMVRDLLEVRLWEGSAVTFPMNAEAVVTSVKSWQTKSVCGNTSGPIGPRDEAWDSGKAEKQIWAAAAKDDGSITAATAKKYFMVCEGDGSKKGDYSYPFWYVGDSPHISVGAVKAIAGAIQGARGASAPDGLKGKVETLYGRINAKYPDAEKLVPPWKEDGKMDTQPKQRKTLIEHYNEEMAEDLLEDWQDVYICALTGAIFDAFTVGDSPEQDVAQALDDFKELILGKFVTQAVECNLSQYLSDNDYGYNPGERTIHNGSNSGSSGYGYMSRGQPLAHKAGRAISASNQENIDEHVTGLHDIADQATKAMKSAMTHMKSLRTAADDFANRMQGAIQPYDGDDPGKPDDGQQEGKSFALALDELRTLRVK